MTDMREALKAALGHIEHMSAWIAGRNAGYSFESLGEDMPGMRAALSSPSPDRLSEAEQKAVEWLRTHQEQCDMDGVMVKVSRQAVDETLAIIDRLSCQPEAEPAAWGDSEGRERPIDAGAMKQLRLNPTTEAYWSRFSIPLYTSPRLDREKVVRFARKFVEEQACGEWTDEIIERDAGKLADAIMRETR